MTSEIRLWLLGTPRLEGAGSAAVLSQQKRLALLAFLAVRREFVRRDDLVATFWADLDQDRARRALSQAIHFLRLSLGDDVIRRRGVGEIGLAESVLSDVTRFEIAIREGRLDEALDLYRGELLQGADGGLTPEFSHWLDAERFRLQRMAWEAASTLACQAYRTDDLVRAVQWQRRALDIRPLDEATLREYIKLLDEAGDAATALAEFDAFRARMAAEFGLDPAPETVKLISLIRRQRPETAAVRLHEARPALAPVAGAVAAEAGAGTVGPLAGGASLSFRRRAGRAVLLRSRTPVRRLVGGFLILAAVAAYWVTERWPRDAHGQPIEYPVERIAFLYIEPRGDTTGLRYLADGLTEEVIHNLSEIDGLRVISSDLVRPFRGKEAPPPDTVVQRLQVNTYIRAKLSNRRGGKHLQLEIQNSSHEIVQPLDFDISEDNILQDIETITRGIVDGMRPVLGTAIKYERLRKGASSNEAWDFYARAAGLEKVLDSYVKLSDTRAMSGVIAEAEELIKQALAHDPSWSEPHLLHGRLAETMGFICGYTAECDHVMWLEQGIKHATIAIEMDSTGAAFELRGRVNQKLAAIGGSASQASSLIDDARNDFHRATRDTLRAGPWSALGMIYLNQGEFEKARQATAQALRKDSFLEDRMGIISNLFRAEFNLDNDTEAEKWCEELRRYQAGKWPPAQCTLTMMNWARGSTPDPDAAWHVLNSVTATPEMRPALEMLVAPILWRVGARDSANEVMRRARNATGATRDLKRYEAAALTRMGRYLEAMAVLSEWINESPAERGHVVHDRWFRPLRETGLNVGQRDAPR